MYRSRGVSYVTCTNYFYIYINEQTGLLVIPQNRANNLEYTFGQAAHAIMGLVTLACISFAVGM